MCDNLSTSQPDLLIAKHKIKIYMIILNISLIILIYSIWQIKPIIVDIEDFLGVTSHLSLVYWIGFALIGVSSILAYLDIKVRNVFFYIYILIILSMYLFGIGIFAEDEARFISSYYPSAEVKNIISECCINTSSNAPLITYRSWPIYHLISVFVIYLANIDIILLIKYMPLFWLICVILISFTIGTSIDFSLNKSFMLSCLLLCSFWMTQYYYCPQAIAYIFYLMSFMLSIHFYDKKSHLLILLIFITLIFTHLMTSFVVLLAFIAIFAHIQKTNKYYILLFIILFIAYYIYLAEFVFEIGVIQFKEQLINMEYLPVINTPKFSGTSEYKSLVNSIRLSYFFIFLLYGGLSIVTVLLGKIRNLNETIFYTCICWLFSASSLIFVKYGAEEFERAYLFCLVPIILIIVMNLSNRSSINKFLLILLLLFVFLLHIPAHYGTESFYQMLTSELAGAKFVAYNVDNPILGHETPSILFFNPKLITRPKIYPLWAGKFSPDKLDRLNPLIYSNKLHNIYIYYLNDDLLIEYINNKNCELIHIYNNTEFRIYLRIPIN